MNHYPVMTNAELIERKTFPQDTGRLQLVKVGNNLFDPNKINYATMDYPDPDDDGDQLTVCTLYFVGSRFPILCTGDQAIDLWEWLLANSGYIEIPSTPQAFEVLEDRSHDHHH